MPVVSTHQTALSVLAGLLFAIAAPAPAVMLTTTDFAPPREFGLVADGVLFPESPYAGLEVTEIRIYWNVVVPDGFNAAHIAAGVILPIFDDKGAPVRIDLDGPDLGWSGDGTFEHADVIDLGNMAFGPVWTFWTHSALGLPTGVPQVLPNSRIEIDYIAPPGPGDLDDDGDVDDADFGLAFAAFTGPGAGPTSNPAADLDNDGDVDDADFGLIFAAFTGPNGSSAVPEPASFAMLGLGLLALHRRKADSIPKRNAG